MNFRKLSLLFLLLVFLLSTITTNADSTLYRRGNIYCCETVAQQAWYTKLIKLENFKTKHISGTLNFELVPDKNAKGEYFREDNQEGGGQINPEESGEQIDSKGDEGFPPGTGGDDFQESVKIVPGVTNFSYKVPFSSEDYVDKEFNRLVLETTDPAGNSLDLFNHAFIHEWGRIDTSDNNIAIRVGKLYEEQFKNINLSQNEVKGIYEKQKADAKKPEYKLSWPGDPDTEGVVGWKSSFGSNYYNSEDHLYDFLGADEFGSQFLNKDEDFRNGNFNVVEKFGLNKNLAVNFYLRMTTRPIAISKTYDEQGNITSIEKPLIPSKDAYDFIKKHNDLLKNEYNEDVYDYGIDKVFRYRLREKTPDGINLKLPGKDMIVDVTAYGDLQTDIHVFEDEESADKFYKKFFDNLDEGSPMDATSLHSDFVFSNENKAKLVNKIEGCTITVDPNGGSWNGNKANIVKNLVKGDVYILPEAPKKDGYKFLYWKGSHYNPGDRYEAQDDHTFVAQWKKNDPPNEVRNPKTGDNSRFILYAVISLGAFTSLLLTIKIKKKYR